MIVLNERNWSQCRKFLVKVEFIDIGNIDAGVGFLFVCLFVCF